MWIAHRINTTEQLKALDESLGIEFDVRDSNGQLIVQHDAFGVGEPFEEYAKEIGHRFCIVNIIAEGIESRVLQILETNAIHDFFLLDCSVPAMVKLSNQGETRLAVRCSEFEPTEFVMRWKGRAQWVWVDCFTYYPLTAKILDLFHTAGFKVCLVGPDLQGRPTEIPAAADWIHHAELELDAICTKVPNLPLWFS